MKHKNENENDIVKNDTPKNCLKNIKHKVKGGYLLHEENFLNVNIPDVRGVKIGKGNDARNLMQTAIMKNQKENIELLKPYFSIKECKKYVDSSESESIKKNMQNTFSNRRSKTSSEKAKEKISTNPNTLLNKNNFSPKKQDEKNKIDEEVNPNSKRQKMHPES